MLYPNWIPPDLTCRKVGAEVDRFLEIFLIFLLTLQREFVNIVKSLTRQKTSRSGDPTDNVGLLRPGRRSEVISSSSRVS